MHKIFLNVILKIDFFDKFAYNGNNKTMLNIIANHTAGGGLATNNIKAITKYLKKENVPYLVYFCEKETDVNAFVEELFKSGEKEFVLVGGDGTIHQFANAVDLSKVSFGVVPSGYHNNFAKTLGLEFNPIKAIEKIIAGNVEHFDYLKCNDIKAVNYISMGCVEEIRHKLKDEKHKPNGWDYLKNLNKCSPLELNISHKDIKEKKYMVNECYIANGKFKDRSKISPLSNMQDGLFNLIVVSNNGKRKLTDYLKIKRGKHIYQEQNKTFWLETISITSPTSPIKAEIDGELYELDQLDISVVEGGLNVYV